MENLRKNNQHICHFSWTDSFCLLILAALVILLVVAAVRYVAYLRLDFLLIATTTEEDSAPASIIVIRDETLIPAPAAGEFSPAYRDGGRIRCGEAVGTISAEQDGTTQAVATPVLSDVSGMVYYELDGWESVLSPASAGETDWLQLVNSLENGSVAALASTELESSAAGRPVCKIVDNLQPFQVFLYTESPLDCFISGEELPFRWEENGITYELSGTVYDRGLLADGREYALSKVERGREALLHTRSLAVTMVGKQTTGQHIPTSAIFFVNGTERCVYRVNQRHLELAPITIVEDYGNEVFVSGLAEGDRIVINPERAKEGQRVFK